MLISLAEAGLLPDWLIRAGLRIIDARLAGALKRAGQDQHRQLTEKLLQGQMVLHSDLANSQHYELPAELFEIFTGNWRKYSCCVWPEGEEALTAAEEASLKQVCDRAGIENGMDLLELGCGWGSFSLWAARAFPDASITAMSNSRLQKQYIDGRAAELGLENLTVITENIETFETGVHFHRVVSIEMFEHVRNWGTLLERIKGWLKPGGRLFAHFFCHGNRTYTFETGRGDWMADHFFSGGLMPSMEFLEQATPEGLSLERSWVVSGTEYARTLNAWLNRLDRRRNEAETIFLEVYGSQWKTWLNRWRLFFMSCAEFFAFNDGNEWYVQHVVLKRAA